jgi:DNA-binding MarR family transcriptional regulator
MPRELASELSLSRSTVTRFLDSLEKRGFLVRTMTAQDGREVQIFPTKSALAIHKELDQTGKKLSKIMHKLIGQQELLETVTNLRKFQKILEAR